MKGTLPKVVSVLWSRFTLYALGALLLIGGSLFFWLRFADPQSHKWVYMFQAYVLPGKCNLDWGIPPDRDFSGTYHRWDWHGKLIEETEMLDGQNHGRNREVSSQTGGTMELHWVHSLIHGQESYWDRDGTLISSGLWQNGRRMEGTFRFEGRKVAFKNGKPWEGVFFVNQLKNGEHTVPGYLIYREGIKVGESFTAPKDP